ncbi:MAG: enoyl-CoA hydratase-related protein, partial [Planctomycetota bacterium]|nr:enoyl-CoA hydratase-related protein [Planctomycetota bacterium]
MSADAIHVLISAPVAVVTIDRPDVRNAFDDAAAAELVAVFDDLASRDEVRVIILEGRGEVFCAGGD